jgi:hypothetical protein
MRATRLELLIVTVAFVVLLLCSRPPNPGTARPIGPASPAAQSVPEPTQKIDVKLPEERNIRQEQTPSAPVAMPRSEPAPQVKLHTKRMATVDARKCPGLKYRDIMYGEVTVRSVWDGSRFVLRKVCVVAESDGTTTVWSFDDPGDAVITEIGEAPADGQP